MGGRMHGQFTVQGSGRLIFLAHKSFGVLVDCKMCSGSSIHNKEKELGKVETIDIRC
jgi:hypothetical protein